MGEKVVAKERREPHLLGSEFQSKADSTEEIGPEAGSAYG